METLHFDNSLTVMCVTATTFPSGIMDAHDKLRHMAPPAEGRLYFGISRPENNGPIVYRAAATLITPDEADTLGLATILLPGGKHLSITIPHYQQDVQAIQRAFNDLLAQPNLDPNGYCIEWYLPDGETVNCMVRVME